jgi:hypothetical protein
LRINDIYITAAAYACIIRQLFQFFQRAFTNQTSRSAAAIHTENIFTVRRRQFFAGLERLIASHTANLQFFLYALFRAEIHALRLQIFAAANIAAIPALRQSLIKTLSAAVIFPVVAYYVTATDHITALLTIDFRIIAG